MATQVEKDELACTYAALILHDATKPVTAASLNKITSAAHLKVQPFWPNLFEQVLAHRSLDDLIVAAGTVGVGGGGGGSAPTPSGGGGGAPTPSGGGGGGGAPPPEDDHKSSEEMGFDLFG